MKRKDVACQLEQVYWTGGLKVFFFFHSIVKSGYSVRFSSFMQHERPSDSIKFKRIYILQFLLILPKRIDFPKSKSMILVIRMMMMVSINIIVALLSFFIAYYH